MGKIGIPGITSAESAKAIIPVYGLTWNRNFVVAVATGVINKGRARLRNPPYSGRNTAALTPFPRTPLPPHPHSQLTWENGNPFLSVTACDSPLVGAISSPHLYICRLGKSRLWRAWNLFPQMGRNS